MFFAGINFNTPNLKAKKYHLLPEVWQDTMKVKRLKKTFGDKSVFFVSDDELIYHPKLIKKWLREEGNRE